MAFHGASEMLTTELGQGNQLRTISGESVAQMRRAGAAEADSFSPGYADPLRENLGTDVCGGFLRCAAAV